LAKVAVEARSLLGESMSAKIATATVKKKVVRCKIEIFMEENAKLFRLRNAARSGQVRGRGYVRKIFGATGADW
jgi:hypothetical protein